MNTAQNSTPDPTSTPAPIARLVRTADLLLRHAAREALLAESVHPTQLRALRAVAAGRDPRRGRGRGMRALIARGWVQIGFDGPTITAEGHATLERLSAIAADARASASTSLRPTQAAALRDGLTALIDAAGGEDALVQARQARRERAWRRGPRPRAAWTRRHGFGPGHGFGHGHGHGFGHGHGHGHGFSHGRKHDLGHGLGHGLDAAAHCAHAHREGHAPGRGHGRHNGPRRSEQAYERGFAAGVEAARR